MFWCLVSHHLRSCLQEAPGSPKITTKSQKTLFSYCFFVNFRIVVAYVLYLWPASLLPLQLISSNILFVLFTLCLPSVGLMKSVHPTSKLTRHGYANLLRLLMARQRRGLCSRPEKNTSSSCTTLHAFNCKFCPE